MLAPVSSSVSLSSLTWLSGKSLHDPSPTFAFTANYYMDLDCFGHGPSCRRVMNSNSDIRYPDTIESSERERQNRHSNPLPQAGWAGLSSSDQQRHRLVAGHDQRPVVHRTLTAREYTAWNQFDPQKIRVSTNPRNACHASSSRESHLLEDHEMRVEPLAVHKSRRRPETSLQGNRLSTNSAPDELEICETRSTTQSNKPLALASNPNDISPVSLPRSPTYPPSARGRASNMLIGQDAALADAEEFHLFVQATVGLELEDAFAFSHADLTSSFHDSRDRHHIPTRVPSYPNTWTNSISPLEESSHTTQAMRHLAQVPQGSQSYLSNLDLQPQPFGTSDLYHEISPLDGSDDFEDQLPDYEESQAQARADRRTEAARRAQELHRRWRLAGARRGI